MTHLSRACRLNLTATETNAGMLALTITMVLVTGALETILWIIGFSAMIIAAHAVRTRAISSCV
jgi:hypothetical protein